MGKKIIEIVAENTTKEIIRILKAYRAVGKDLDDVIAVFEKREPEKGPVIIGKGLPSNPIAYADLEEKYNKEHPPESGPSLHPNKSKTDPWKGEGAERP